MFPSQIKKYRYYFASFKNIVHKVNAYSGGMNTIGVLHKMFFLCISILLMLGGFLYKRKMLNPIVITVVLFYYVSFFINPIAGYRFSPYLLFTLFFYNFEDDANEKVMRFLNVISVLLFPCFLYTLFDTHIL
jgi:uncharacterized membrane protein